MNWYHRGEERYVEYGTSFGASRAFGIRQSLTDTIYNMNLEHLSRDVETVFETLDDADVRTAGTTYLMYRGRHRHEPSVDTALDAARARRSSATPVYGPARVLLRRPLRLAPHAAAARSSACPGVRDQHAGCVGEYLVEHDLFDFLLLSLPDNDTHSHKNGPFAQVDSIAAADRQIERMMARRRRARRVPRGPRGDRLLGPLAVPGRGGDRPVHGVRRLRRARRRPRARRRGRRDRASARTRARRRSTCSTATARARADPADRAHAARARGRRPRDAHDRPPRRRGGRPRRARGASRSCASRPRGDLDDRARRRAGASRATSTLLGLQIEDGQRALGDLPGRARRACGRRCAAARPARCWRPRSPGYEFLDWGGAHHVGGGSHGSLHANDSLGSLLWCGTGPDERTRASSGRCATSSPMG